MNIYQQQILDHYHNPRNFGKPDSFTHSQKLENLNCGDEVTMYLTVNEIDGIIAQAHFDGQGCAISIAAASLLTDELVGKVFSDIASWDVQTMLDLLGITLTTSRLKCASLGLEAAQQALEMSSSLD